MLQLVVQDPARRLRTHAPRLHIHIHIHIYIHMVQARRHREEMEIVVWFYLKQKWT